MSLLADVLVLIVAAIHGYILVLEMFLWQTPRGMKAFGTDPEFAKRSATLAANQGLYNGFLAAGLIWGLVYGGPVGAQIQAFFLICVVLAGVFGSFTAKKSIIFVQALPALLALGILYFGW